MNTSLDHKKVTISRSSAISLLYPITVFLQISGLPRLDAEKSFATAYKRASKVLRGRRLQRIGLPTRYADIIAHWSRSSRYVDLAGRPRVLNIHGVNGFKALVSKISPSSNYLEVLDTLSRFGNIRRDARKRVILVRPFFHTVTTSNIAFEPSAYFLADACQTLSKILTRTPKTRDAEGFWRKAENARLTTPAAKKFASYARERTQLFLEEIDDWLEAHSKTPTKSRNAKYHRVGLGVVSVMSKPDPYQRRR